MSKYNNTPPFRIGEEVVCVRSMDAGYYKKGTIYTVKGIFQCKCGKWFLDIGLITTRHSSGMCSVCKRVLSYIGDPVLANAANFRRINPYSTSVSAELAQEAMKERVEVDNPVKEIVNN